MKPDLVIGLGNPLMGDEGIGSRVAECLATDARLPSGAEVLQGGTDLFRCASHMEGRRRIFLIDAIMDGREPGSVSVWHERFEGWVDQRQHAHHLSAPDIIRLLRIASPALRNTRFTFVAIAIESSCIAAELSPALQDVLPGIVDRTIDELQH